MVETSAEAVERLAARLDRATLYDHAGECSEMPEDAAATLRALVAERDAARECAVKNAAAGAAWQARALTAEEERDAARAALRLFIEAADPAMLSERDHPHRVFREARLAAEAALGEPAA